MPPKTAYLTIDDAPSPDMRFKLDALLERAIPAALFCTGRDLDARPSLAVYAIQQGFVLGNHSYSHPHFSTLNLRQCRTEIRRTSREVFSFSVWRQRWVIGTQTADSGLFAPIGLYAAPV